MNFFAFIFREEYGKEEGYGNTIGSDCKEL